MTGAAPWRARGPAFEYALVVGLLALAFVAGLAIVDDYGLAGDQRTQHRVGKYAVQYLFGESHNLWRHNLRYYGPFFEIALRLPEWLCGFTDDHDIFLSRYALSHGFFLLGALACYALTKRMLGSRALAAFALLCFLLHPRIYAHSFFNSKDTPFLAMFVIALLLARRAFDAKTAWSFAALGLWIGMIASVRPMALLLAAVVAAACAVDYWRARCQASAERTRNARALLAFAPSVVGGCYVAMPFFWGDPFGRVGEWIALMSDHTHIVRSLFRGDVISSADRPVEYVPVWIAVTTPPLALVLAGFGVAAACARAVADPPAVVGNTPLRFEMILIALVVVPVVVVSLWVGNLYNGWRHMYFLYGPLCVLAAVGLHWLIRRLGPFAGRFAGATAAAGLVAAACWLAILHPHQHVYFNFLVDRATPERLRSRFDMDYWGVPFKEALDALLRRQPQGAIPVAGPIALTVPMLPPRDRQRVSTAADFGAFLAMDYRYWWAEGVDEGFTYAEPVYARKVFSNTLYAIVRLAVAEDEGEPYWRHYHEATARPPVAEGPFQVYWDGKAVTYVRRNCRPEDVEHSVFTDQLTRPLGRFFLHVVGEAKREPGGLGHNLDFQFRHRGVVLRLPEGDACMARVELDDYVVDGFRTGQLAQDWTPSWEAKVTLVDRAALRQTLATARAATPLPRQGADGFDVFLLDRNLVYVKERCRAADTATPIFLHVAPARREVLPERFAQRGFVNRDFDFGMYGVELDGVCVARVRLPDFRVARLRTGQDAPAKAAPPWRVDATPGE